MHRRCSCCSRSRPRFGAAAPPSNSGGSGSRYSSSPPMRRAALSTMSSLLLQRRPRRGGGPTNGAFFFVRAISSSSSPSPSTSSSSIPPPPLTPLPAALARARARAATPTLTFHVAGVSFEGRQRAASFLQKSQPLALRRERRNEFDPRAVAVETLDGKERIGYVPRGETDKALPEDADAAFAFVRSVGRAHLKEEAEEEGEGRRRREEGAENEKDDDDDDDDGGGGEERCLGPLGVSVALKPGLAPLEIDALPSMVLDAGPLSSALREHEWKRLAKEAALASGFRCSVTGGTGGAGAGGAGAGAGGAGAGEGKENEIRSAPVEAHEHWRVDDEGRVATLLGVRALCPEAHDVASPEARARALLTLRTVNAWSAKDAALYWRGREELAATRSKGGSGDGSVKGDGGGGGSEREEEPKRKNKYSAPPWRIDARWLVSQGVDLEGLSPAWRELLL